MEIEKIPPAGILGSFNHLELLVQEAPLAVAVFDREMRYLAASQRWKEDFNCTERELIGQLHYEFFPNLPERWKAIHRQALAGEFLRADDDEWVHPNGDRRWASWAVHPWRNAYQEIGGFVEEVLWDGIDVHTARMKGWNAYSFEHPEAQLYHHRLMGSSDRNVYRGRLRWGRGIYFMGYHPLYAIASGIFRMREKPYLIGGLLIITGYFKAALQGVPRYDQPEFIRYLQAWQLDQLKSRLFGKSR